jgi:hypothetical protein
MTDLDRGFAAGWHDEQYANRHRRMPPDWTPPDMITQAEADAKARRAFGRGFVLGILPLWIGAIIKGWLL